MNEFGSAESGAGGGDVLLVEDDPGHAALIRRVLGAGVPELRLHHCATLAEAREQVASIVPELALVDMNLPDGSGLDLIAAGEDATDTVPVVIMTGQGCEEIAAEAMRRGALDYVVKTAGEFPGSLVHAVGRALREVDNIRERRRAERTARRLADQYRALYDEAPAMLFTVDADDIIVSVNRFGERHMGYSADALIGRPVTILYPEAEHAAVRGALASVRDDAESVAHWELRKRCREGSIFWAGETARAVEDADGVLQTLMVSEDITDSRERAQQLAYEASHDALTGLVNRREFERRLERVLSESGPATSEHVLCYVDLDEFKVVNDTCGHAAGDELLRTLARRLRSRVRKRDTLARLGGDEFGLLMEHCSEVQGMRVAESVRKGVYDTLFRWEGQSFKVGASIGLVPITSASTSVAEVMIAADSACYTAKNAGRNRVHVCRVGDSDPDLKHDPV